MRKDVLMESVEVVVLCPSENQIKLVILKSSVRVVGIRYLLSKSLQSVKLVGKR